MHQHGCDQPGVMYLRSSHKVLHDESPPLRVDALIVCYKVEPALNQPRSLIRLGSSQAEPQSRSL